MARLSTRLLGAGLFSLSLAPAQDPTGYITAENLRADVAFLASDDLEGRGVGTRGDWIAQMYIETQFRLAGLAPGGPDGQWRQAVPLVGISSGPKGKLAFTSEARKDPLECEHLADFVANVDGVKDEAAWHDAEVVFVGYGIEAPEEEWDDYKDVDVSGKVLLMMNNDPYQDPDSFGGTTRLYYGRWTYKFEIAAKKGALGAIIIHNTPSAGYPWAVVQQSMGRERFIFEGEDRPGLAIKGWLTERASRALAIYGGHDLVELRKRAQRRDFRPVPLGVRANLEVAANIRKLDSANICGLLEGNDPERKNEVVVVTSHFDHLGVGRAQKDDGIYNGAVDNATGVAGLLNIARALTRTGVRGKRSILFLAVTAEESGLLGSLWYARNPTFPKTKIAANLNIDSLNRFGPTEDISIIGLHKSDLADSIRAEADKMAREVLGDQDPDKGLFYRSDQFSFAREGIPAVFFGAGTKLIGKPPGEYMKLKRAWTSRHYHRPSDEIGEDWNLEGAARDMRLFCNVILHVANQPEMPKWRPGDEFENRR